MADIAKIAAGLSEAQRRAVMELPVTRDFRPSITGFPWSTLSVLKSKRLINGVADGLAGMGKTAMHRMTPRGLAVRNYLRSKNDV